MLRNHSFDNLAENLIDTDSPPAEKFLHPLAMVGFDGDDSNRRIPPQRPLPSKVRLSRIADSCNDVL